MIAKMKIVFCLVCFVSGVALSHPAKKQLEIFTKYLLDFKWVEEGENKKITKADVEKNRVGSKKAIAVIDLKTISSRALGKKVWTKMGKAKQKKFVKTLRRLVVLNAFPRSGRFLKKVEYKFSNAKVLKGVATVRQTVTIKGDEENPEDTEMLIDYSFEKIGSTWRVTNVAFDEVSLVETYSNQFANIINKKGLSGLLSLMENKKKELEEEYGKVFPE